MNYTEYFTNYLLGKGNELKLNEEQQIRLDKIKEVEKTIEKIKASNGWDRYTSNTTKEIELLKNDLFGLTQFNPPYRLLREMEEKSKE